VDNLVFLLAEESQGTPLTEKQAQAVSMVIEEDPQRFHHEMQDLVKKGLLAFDTDAGLRKRMTSLQPFNDTSSIPATSPALARLTGDRDLGKEHPLVLLRSYSNEDKHRSIRVAAAGALVQDEDEWPPREANMKPVAVGQVLGVVPKGTPKIMSISAALLVQRPTSTRWIAPGPELDAITEYVSDIAIPTLVTGMALPGALPGEVNLKDNGQSLGERLARGGVERALERSRARTTSAFFEAMQADLRFPPIVSELDVE
jgi:hypothetical protein